MDTILHRLSCLVIHKLCIPSNRVDLLFGSFVHWALNWEQYQASPKIVSMAKDIHGGGDGGGVSVQFLLLLRMCCVWELYETHASGIDDAYTFPYYIGVAMDIHIPGIRLGTHTSMHELYVNRKAPELVRIDDIDHDSSSRINANLIVRHWMSYMCRLGPDRAPSKKATTETPVPCGAARRASARKSEMNSLIDPWAKVGKSAVESEPGQDTQTLMETLVKGQPNPSVYRYVRKGFIKGLTQFPERNKVIVRITRMFLLGTYRHARIIAPPKVRYNVYINHTTHDLFREIAEYTTKNMYNILAEAIVAATYHNMALVSMVMCDADHIAYKREAMYNGDKLRDSRFSYKIPLVKPPKTKCTKPRPTNFRIFWVLYKVLEVKHKVPTKKVVEAIKGIGYRKLYTMFQKQPNRLRLYDFILRGIDMPASDLTVLRDMFSLNNNDIVKNLKRLVKTMTTVGFARLYLYVHYIKTRAMLSYVPIGHTKDITPHESASEPTMLVCGNCYTIRTQCLSDNVHKKSKSGVENDIVLDLASCSGCKSTDIYVVDMRRTFVYGPSMTEPTVSRMYCACTLCGIMTIYKYVVGQSEFCKVCYFKKIGKHLVIRKCMCGKILDDKMRYPTLNALNERGEVSIYGLCTDHAFVKKYVPDSCLQSIDFFRTVVKLHPVDADRKRRRTFK